MLFCCLGIHHLSAQSLPFSATVDCINHPNRVVAVNMPPVNSATTLWTGAFKYENPCRRLFLWGNGQCGNGSNQPLYTLERFNFGTGVWSTFAGPQTCPTFSNLPHGTWRVKGQNPIEENGSGCEEGHILIYNTAGQFIGYKGTYTNAPTVTSTITVTEPTLQSEINATYIETYGILDNALFNVDETPKMNTTGTINYTHWWIAIFERGGQNRYGGLAWTPGFIPNNEIDLKVVWNQAGFPDFDYVSNGVTYDVQFAIAGPCNPVWIESPITNFGVCPGMNCREVFEDSDMSLSPNPANTTFRLSGLDLSADNSNLHLRIMDLSGRIVKEFAQVNQDEFDISELSNGLYLVNVLEGENHKKSLKLSVAR